MGIGISIAAAAAALASAVFIFLQVREMQRQTKLQREIAESSAQPYIWGDVRLQGIDKNLEFVIGNSGPTVATNVRVRIDPPLPSDGDEGRYVDVMHQRLRSGVSSLAPGRTLHWTLGNAGTLVSRTDVAAHLVRIECDGPFGAVEPSEYTIDFADFRESVARHDGSLRDVTNAVSRLVDRLPKSHQPFRVRLESDDD